MISRTYKTEPLKENPHKVDVRQLYSDETAQVMHVTLKPGETLKPHVTPVDVVFYNHIFRHLIWHIVTRAQFWTKILGMRERQRRERQQKLRNKSIMIK